MTVRECGHTIYTAGCGYCQTYARVHKKKNLRDQARYGPGRLPGQVGAVIINYAKEAQISPGELAEKAGLAPNSVWRIGRGESPTIYRSTVRRLVSALGPLLDERVEALEDLRAAIEYAAGEREAPRRWPTGPLRRAAAARNVKLAAVLEERDRRAVYRGSVGDDTAERVCGLLGVDPSDVWDGWFE